MTEADVEVENALYEAIEQHDLSRFEQLLEAHPTFRHSPDGRDRWLEIVARDGLLSFVQLLVGRGADVNQPLDDLALPANTASAANPEGAVCRAAENGHLDVVRWLLDQGAKVNFVLDGQIRCKALGGAARGGHLEVARLLVERGADVNAGWGNRTPLEDALMYGRTAVADYLRSVGGKTAAERRNEVLDAIYEAVGRDDVAAFGGLLDAHPELRRHDDGRDRWFAQAAEDGALAVVQWLVGRGTDVNEPANDDSVPCPEGVVYRAAENGQLDVVRWLLDQGAEVNFEVEGQTRCYALSGAARGGHLAVARLLVERGAAVNACWAGMTPLDHALAAGRADVADYLRSAGGKRAAELA